MWRTGFCWQIECAIGQNPNFRSILEEFAALRNIKTKSLFVFEAIM